MREFQCAVTGYLRSKGIDPERAAQGKMTKDVSDDIVARIEAIRKKEGKL